MTDADSTAATQIVEAARSSFLRFGYSRVSTEEIARSIGRSKKTLYKHFASKESLLHAVLALIDRETGRELAGLLAEAGGDRHARLRSILTTVAVRLASVHQVLLADLRACSPELGLQAWRGRRRALASLLTPVLHEAVEEQVVRSDLTADQVLEIFFSCVEGMVSPVEAGPGAQDPGKMFGALVCLMVDGLAGPRGGAPRTDPLKAS